MHACYSEEGYICHCSTYTNATSGQNKHVAYNGWGIGGGVRINCDKQPTTNTWGV
eukprot:m.160272 g.160272  ORF g.160272 m.160272 type:complete len:55 (+) comp18016_c0_seq2:838-1002(+)